MRPAPPHLENPGSSPDALAAPAVSSSARIMPISHNARGSDIGRRPIGPGSARDCVSNTTTSADMAAMPATLTGPRMGPSRRAGWRGASIDRCLEMEAVDQASERSRISTPGTRKTCSVSLPFRSAQSLMRASISSQGWYFPLTYRRHASRMSSAPVPNGETETWRTAFACRETTCRGPGATTERRPARSSAGTKASAGRCAATIRRARPAPRGSNPLALRD